MSTPGEEATAHGDHGTHGDPGYQHGKAAYLRRLKLIEGQVRGIQRMVDEDTYCIDVLTQVSAVTKALQSVALGLVDDHVHHCVHDAAGSGDTAELDRKMDEIMGAVKRLMR
ncbi:metal-sensing transcriptional repressor [Brachybacterium squillarum]|uniref:metal-sensitive transcriptional regulator n=1 Tax=Brachybacterium squillarum TaxID=661979 RepID=UPI00026293C7